MAKHVNEFENLFLIKDKDADRFRIKFKEYKIENGEYRFQKEKIDFIVISNGHIGNSSTGIYGELYGFIPKKENVQGFNLLFKEFWKEKTWNWKIPTEFYVSFINQNSFEKIKKKIKKNEKRNDIEFPLDKKVYDLKEYYLVNNRYFINRIGITMDSEEEDSVESSSKESSSVESSSVESSSKESSSEESDSEESDSSEEDS